MTIEDGIMRCPICRVAIEDIYLFPGVIARFYKWNNIDNNDVWYCPKHSIKDIKNFEEKIR